MMPDVPSPRWAPLTLSRFEPSASNWETTLVRAPRPKLTMAMNALTPMASPRAVSALRPGLRMGTCSASRIASLSFLSMGLFLLVGHHATVAHADHALGAARHLGIVRDQQDGQARLLVQ